MSGNAQLTVDGKTLDLERVEAVNGNDGFLINQMLGETGTVTLDPGFTNTASTTSKITYIDGEQGILRYRGYPIEQIAEKCSFLETAYLLIYGELPTQSELDTFTAEIDRYRELPSDYRRFYENFPTKASPMAMIQAAIAGLGDYYPDSLDPLDPEARDLATKILLAKVPILTANAQKHGEGHYVLQPDPDRLFVEDFLNLALSTPGAEPLDPLLVHALEKLLILHADHEQNCSTSTVRVVGSSNASMYAAISAGVGALAGPLHGGANKAALDMFDHIKEEGLTIKEFVNQVKAKKNGVKLMGFGHRVYRNYDPRARVVKGVADEILEKLHGDVELFDMARELEQTALSDDYFIERKLYPNVDFYTGVIYKAMGFPVPMFPALFVVGRLPGWIAQYREMLEDPNGKIARPRQVYQGYDERNVPEMSER
ncbi:MAG: citrate synthase [Actinomycetaceae bacterium]|nr:citrate synthase [Arcanobacterium sp.]MDD7504648.1 citrate synthase [Actinomycetaceae bacterium]MDY6142651.1 citrate synthase [Arcanobacterium sp.]